MTGDGGVGEVPVVVTDGAPPVRVAHLDPASPVVAPSHEPHVAFDRVDVPALFSFTLALALLAGALLALTFAFAFLAFALTLLALALAGVAALAFPLTLTVGRARFALTLAPARQAPIVAGSSIAIAVAVAVAVTARRHPDVVARRIGLPSAPSPPPPGMGRSPLLPLHAAGPTNARTHSSLKIGFIQQTPPSTPPTLSIPTLHSPLPRAHACPTIGVVRRLPPTIVALAIGGVAPSADAGPGEVIERTGEREQDPGQAWRLPGFRMRLAAGRELLTPASELTGPATEATAIVLRPGIRLDDRWLIEADFRYGVMLGAVQGLRWTATADLSYRVADGAWADGLVLGVGAGYAGFNVLRKRQFSTARFRANDVAGELPVASARELEEARPCSAGGAAALIRAGWLWDVTPAFATGPTVQLDTQWTACEPHRPRVVAGTTDPDATPRARIESFTEPETWRHDTMSVVWIVAWR